MARDQEEELQRLDEALWEDEDWEDEEDDQEDEDLLEEETLDQLLHDEAPGSGSRIYRNYSNGYGQKLRNYASGYRAYNSDRCDVDLDDYSESVRKEKPAGAGLVILACVLTAGIVAVLIWWLLRYGGML